MSINNNPNGLKTEECYNMAEFAAMQVYHLMIEATGGKGIAADTAAEDLEHAINVIWNNAPLSTPLAAGYAEPRDIARRIATEWYIDEIRCCEVVNHSHATYVHGWMYIERLVPERRANLGGNHDGTINVTWSISSSGEMNVSVDLAHLENMPEADIVFYHDRFSDFWQVRWMRHCVTR